MCLYIIWSLPAFRVSMKTAHQSCDFSQNLDYETPERVQHIVNIDCLVSHISISTWHWGLKSDSEKAHPVVNYINLVRNNTISTILCLSACSCQNSKYVRKKNTTWLHWQRMMLLDQDRPYHPQNLILKSWQCQTIDKKSKSLAAETLLSPLVHTSALQLISPVDTSLW